MITTSYSRLRNRITLLWAIALCVALTSVTASFATQQAYAADEELANNSVAIALVDDEAYGDDQDEDAEFWDEDSEDWYWNDGRDNTWAEDEEWLDEDDDWYWDDDEYWDDEENWYWDEEEQAWYWIGDEYWDEDDEYWDEDEDWDDDEYWDEDEDWDDDEFWDEDDDWYWDDEDWDDEEYWDDEDDEDWYWDDDEWDDEGWDEEADLLTGCVYPLPYPIVDVCPSPYRPWRTWCAPFSASYQGCDENGDPSVVRVVSCCKYPLFRTAIGGIASNAVDALPMSAARSEGASFTSQATSNSLFAQASEDDLSSQAADDSLFTQQSGSSLFTQASYDANATSQPTKAQREAFKTAASDFSMELFNRCVAAKGKNTNVTVSPVSVLNALAVTANGAAGSTATEMRQVLGDSLSKKEFNQSLNWYNNSLANTEKAKLLGANSIWYHNDNTLTVKKKFLKTNKQYYDAEVRPADFSNPQTVTDINSWVADKTNNMIKRIISQLNEDDRLAIVNALYFDAKWLSPFDKSDVFKAKFTNAKGKTRKVDMMYGTEGKYIEGEGVCGFVKPYAEGYSYVALLPDEGIKLKDFVAKLDGNAFSSLVTGATNQRVIINMPKYTVAYTNDQMENQLAAMGIKRAFADDADFSKMATSTTGNICLGRVVHKTKVQVDEEGTKAAAATAVIAKESSALIDVKRVTLDRPFVYAIVDNTVNLPIFIGTVNNVK